MINVIRKFLFFIFLISPICCGGIESNPAVFVGKIYSQYQSNKIPDLLGADGDTIFTSNFLEKYRTLAKMSSKRHGLGWDPLCECDDTEFPGYSITDVRIKTVVTKPDFVKIEVLFKNSGFGASVLLVLRKKGGKWLIDDLETVDMPSLLNYIDANLKRKRLKGNDRITE